MLYLERLRDNVPAAGVISSCASVVIVQTPHIHTVGGTMRSRCPVIICERLLARHIARLPKHWQPMKVASVIESEITQPIWDFLLGK